MKLQKENEKLQTDLKTIDDQIKHLDKVYKSVIYDQNSKQKSCNSTKDDVMNIQKDKL